MPVPTLPGYIAGLLNRSLHVYALDRGMLQNSKLN